MSIEKKFKVGIACNRAMFRNKWRIFYLTDALVNLVEFRDYEGIIDNYNAIQ